MNGRTACREGQNLSFPCLRILICCIGDKQVLAVLLDISQVNPEIVFIITGGEDLFPTHDEPFLFARGQFRRSFLGRQLVIIETSF